MDHRIINGFKISQQPFHDIAQTEKFLLQCYRTRKSDLHLLHKGYDSEDIYKLIRDDQDPYSLIPVRISQRKKDLWIL